MSSTGALEKALEIAAHIEELGPIAVRRYFGGAALVAGKTQFAILMSGRLYLRADGETRASLRALGGKPFTYQGKGRIIEVRAYYEAPSIVVNDPNRLAEYAMQAYRNAAALRRSRKRANVGTGYRL